MSEARRAAELCDAGRVLLADWAVLWERPGLHDAVRVEISHRLRRALGRTHPERRLIRLTHALLDAPDDAFAEVLCHEAAHVVVFERHRRAVRPHGREWAELMHVAGYHPRVRVDPRELGIAWTPPAPTRRRRSPYVYEHHCPACGMTRQARRAVTQWRCARCREAGLEGALEIRRWPVAALRSPGRAG